jgi:hypothetical protein
MESVKQPCDIDVKNLKVSPLKTMGNGVTRIAFVTLDGPFNLQLPEMYAPFGINVWENSDNGTFKYSVNLSFRDMDKRESLQKFYKFLEDFDEFIVQYALDHSYEFFKKKYTSLEVVRALYPCSIKQSIDKATGEINPKYPPTCKITIPYRNDKFQMETYNKDAELIDFSTVMNNLKGAKITVILQGIQLWIAGGKFGATLKSQQMQVIPKATISGFAIKNNKEDRIPDGEDIDEVTNDMSKTTVTNGDNLIDDSDDENN